MRMFGGILIIILLIARHITEAREGMNMNRIIKTNNDYVGILWVIKARSTEESRYGLQFITAKDGEIIATDGHRLHIYKTEMVIKNGNYEVISSNKNEIILEAIKDIEYPKWEDVFPKDEPTKIIEIKCYSKKVSEAYTSLVRCLPIENTVNLKYFEDLLCISNKVTFLIHKKEEPIEFRTGKYRGLIMPIRMGY
jgi:hypothetical protein